MLSDVFIGFNQEVDVFFLCIGSVVVSVILVVVLVLVLVQFDGYGVFLVRSGLGQMYLVVVNLSFDLEWWVYGFQCDGILYFQVNDFVGWVQLIIGCVDDVFWMLFVGESLVCVLLLL